MSRLIEAYISTSLFAQFGPGICQRNHQPIAQAAII